MDKEALVEKLKEVFINKRKDGLYIDALGLAPAYYGMIRDSYTLGISAPSMKGLTFGTKVNIIIGILFKYLSEDERGFIDRVRIFDSIDELDEHKDRDFEDYYPEDFEYSARRKSPRCMKWLDDI